MSIARLFTSTATVETCTGQSTGGPVFAAPVPVACYRQQRQQPARDPEGYDVLSTVTLFAATADAGKFTAGTRVTVDGRIGYVIAAYRFEHGPAAAHHVKVMVT